MQLIGHFRGSSVELTLGLIILFDEIEMTNALIIASLISILCIVIANKKHGGHSK
jgi:ABC-type sulfate transport system permease subunit